MVRKRASAPINISTSDDETEGDDFEDIQCSQIPSVDCDLYPSLSETQIVSEVSAIFKCSK